MYAVIEASGRQYKVSEGDTIKIGNIEAKVGKEVVFDSVLYVSTDKGLSVGAPYVKGAKVIAKVVNQGRERKVITFKYRRRKNTHRKIGHRQPFTGLKIEKIVYEG